MWTTAKRDAWRRGICAKWGHCWMDHGRFLQCARCGQSKHNLDAFRP